MQLLVRRSRPGPRPDLPPGVAGDEVLEVLGERRRALDRAVDVLVPEHLPAAPPFPARGSRRGSRSCALPFGLVAGERAVDEGARRAEVRRRVEHLVELRRGQPRLARHGVAQRPAVLRRPAAMRSGRACAPRRARAARRGRGRAARRRSRLPTGRGWLACASHRPRARPVRRRARRPHRPWSRARPTARPPRPATLPRRARAPRPAAPIRTDACPRASSAPARAHVAPTGFRFCGIADEPPPSPASRTSATSVWAEELQVEGDLPDHAGDDRERRAELDDRRAVRVPGERRLGERELAGEERGDLDAVARRAPRGFPPRRRAGREGSRRSSARRPRASASPTSHPAALSPNVVGTACWRRVRPAIGVSRCARASSAQASAASVSRSTTRPRARRATSIAAVSTMSWLVAPEVHPPSGVLPGAPHEGPHECVGGTARAPPFEEQHVPVVGVGRALLGDRGGGILGDDAGERAGVRERPLGLQHRLEPGPAGDRLAQVVGDEQGVERRHTAKNVVSCGPCKRMSNRRAPSSAIAMRLSRPPGGSPESTGSASFASISSGK